MPNRISLGFDMRVKATLTGITHRSAQMVKEYGSIISADPAIWPCATEVSDLWDGPLPSFLNPLYLAGDLKLLVDAHRKRNASLAELIPVCLTAKQTVILALDKRFGSGYFSRCVEEQNLIHQGWQLRGFDVVDLDGLISGLKGCGYSDTTKLQVEAAFGRFLNEDGLFRSEEAAYTFAEMRGLEIRGHAPFTVTGILTHETLLSCSES